MWVGIVPSETKTLPRVSNTNVLSVKCFLSNQGAETLLSVLERLVVTRQQASAQRARQMNPAMRTPQPKPQEMNRRWSMIGYTTPPAEKHNKRVMLFSVFP